MTHLEKISEARDAFFRQHGYLPNTLIISAPNLQSLRSHDLLLVEGLRVDRRQGNNIEFGHENKKKESIGASMERQRCDLKIWRSC